ncbi:hypothetical protein DFH08DRAFT_837577 [Mycena albidolilacea]|uniref:Poly(A) RNA polymerase mitochondrial-like central palm domain-containing protein n=1 Tax=Mycena albidolilacea TaxID=1033008 RepID=A0AAD7F390_9AGAR|nr:hypothetical protein DFH08DRAFT_837577 [Mycena albidolilacea]
MTPPKPISLEGRGRKLAEDQGGWGLNSPVHKPSFWRPAHVREPLTLPTNSGSSGPLHAPPVTGTGTTNSVPLARETRAGIAYKNVLPKPKGFHTTAYCAARRVPELRKVIGRALDPTVLQSRRQTLFMVQDAIQKAFGTDYRVELFGSTRYGISSAKSDLDMVLLDPHHPYGAAPGYEWDVQQTPVYNLRTVTKILKKAGFFIFETLPQASVPIIKFIDNRTGHRVDLNINDRLGVLNSDLIKRYCELNPVLVPMIQYVKLWAKPLGLNSPSRNHLNKPMTFSSYALVMMTIGFLQHRGLLPNLQEDLPPLEPGKLKGTFWLHKPRILCCDVRYNMAEDWTPPEDIPVEQLMQDWFNFWGHSFKFEDEMISIREGGRIPRPPRVSGGTPFNGLFWNIDPFIRTKNITGNIARGSLLRFTLECRNSAASKEFEQDVLPRPRSYDQTEKIAGLDELMTPLEMRSATWIPVDEIPSWNRTIPNGNRDLPPHQCLSPNRPEELSAPATPGSSTESLLEILASPLDTGKRTKPDKKEAGKKAGKKTKPIRTKTEWSVGEEFPVIWHDPLEVSKLADDEVEVEVKVDVDFEVDTPKNLSETADGGAAETAGQPPRIPDPNDSTAATNDQEFDYDPTLRFDGFGRFLRPEPRRRPPPEEPEEDQVGFGLR